MKVEDMKPALRTYLSSREATTVDQWGHVKWVGTNGRQYRYKFQQNTIRFERKLKFSDGRTEWQRIRTYNIKKLYNLCKQKGFLS